MALAVTGLAAPVAAARTAAGRGGREMLLSRPQGLVLCSGEHRDEWGKRGDHSQASLSSSSSRRIALFSLGFPLVHLANGLVVGGAKATPLVESQPLEAGGTAVEVFGFDGLGKASEEYVPGKIVALAQAGDGAVLFLGR